MITELKIADVTIEIVKKDIKNIHLSVNPPNGFVRLAVPVSASANVIRTFALSKLGWIRKNQKKMRLQEREKPRQYIERETHYIWGRQYLLHIVDGTSKTHLVVSGKRIKLHKRDGVSVGRVVHVFDDFYKAELLDAVLPLVEKWAKALGVRIPAVEIRKMKTRWGSCNTHRRIVRLNSELAKRPKELLSYVVLHEMTHLLQKTHNQHFFDTLDKLMPNWQHYRAELNRLPIPFGNWE